MKHQLFTLLFTLLCLPSLAQKDTLYIDQGVVTLATNAGTYTIPPPISFEVIGTTFNLTGGNGSRLSFLTGQLQKLFVGNIPQSISVNDISAALTASAVSRTRQQAYITARSDAAEYEFQILSPFGQIDYTFQGDLYTGFRLYNWSSDTIMFTMGGAEFNCLPYSSFIFSADFDQEAGRYFACPTATFYAPSDGTGRAVLILSPIQRPGN